MLDFGALPPEINSGRMYAGPGVGPMLAATAAWDALAVELHTTATGSGAVLSELAEGWLGPASLSMATAAAPYVMWLHSTAATAEQTAAHTKSAAAAYELAFAMTVPPPVIAANRSLLVALIATNFFGQNTPAIAVTEAHYAEMWVQDAAAMYGYAASSAAACRLTSFTEPPQTTDPAGPAAQAGAVSHATGSAVGGQTAAVQQLAAPAASTSSSMLVALAEHVPNVTNSALSSSNAVVSGRNIAITNARLANQATRQGESDALSAGLASAVLGRPAVSVAMGRATMAGALSVPAGWATAAPQIQPVTLASAQIGTVTGAADATTMPTAPGSVFSQAAIGTLSRNGVDRPRPKTKPVIVRSPAAG